MGDTQKLVTEDARAGTGKAAEKDGPTVALAHRHIFGLKSGVKGNVHFTDETHFLYPAGHNTILYHAADQKTQTRVFPGSEGSEGITCLAVSPNRKFLAVGEKFQERAICYIFDINTGKRRRGHLSYADCDAKEFVCAAFSAENKFLITQGGPPDWTLILWSWDKARPHGAVKVSNLTGSVIHECSFNPQDPSLVCVIGDGVFKFFRLQEGTFKAIPNQLNKLREASNQNYVCHTWLHDDRLVVCSEGGDALLFDSGGEFKMVLPCSTGEPRSMLCITAFSKGFIVGGEKGTITFFERSEDAKEMFRKAKEVSIEGNISASGIVGSSNAALGAITSLAASPTEETLAIATSTNQLLQLSLSPSDLLKTEESAFENVLTSFHTGPIMGLDVCVRKPLVVTCGKDMSVRIWNYLDKTQELCKFFGEEAYSVAFHPSGFHLIVGFSDKLRLMNLLMEDLRTFKEIPIKGCRECRFSNGGQFFAAVNSNTVQVYKTYTCEVVCNLRGHQSKVRSLCWNEDDSRLVTTGADGTVFEYDITKEGRRLSEWAQKGTSFSCVTAYTTSDSTSGKQSNTMFVTGSDKMLKEVQNSELTNWNTELTNYLESNALLGQLVLAPSCQALFAGVSEPDVPGALRCYTFPLNGDYLEYQAHSAAISRVRLTHDEQYLFSAGDDGCLCIFDLKKTVPSKRDKDAALGHADEILVTRAFLDDKQAVLLDLERKVEELTGRIDFQLRNRDGYHKEKMAELQEKYSEEIETERRKFEILREEKAEMEMENEEKIRNAEETHAKQTQEYEQAFRQKMLVEEQRFQKLEDDLQREETEWEAQRRKLLQEHTVVIEQIHQEAEKQQRANKDSQDRIIKEKEQAFKHHQETLAQLEQDADREIEELKEMYEQKLAQEKADKVRLRGEAGINQKHHDDLKRIMLGLEDEVRKEKERSNRAEEKIVGLNKDKDSSEKEKHERDKTITDKEQRIYDLKKQNQELEKFRFVLDYKIKELKAQIDPKTADIASMKAQTQAMDDELNDYMRKNKQLALDISQLQMKQRALQEEIKSQKRRLKDDLSLIKRFKLDLSDCMETVAEPKSLKESITKLYQKYITTGSKKLDLDTDMQKEYNRQRDYLEKSVDSLKRKLEKDSQAHRIDNMRIMQENVSLIREINDLRREINALKHDRVAQELQSMSQAGGTNAASQQLEKEVLMQKEEIEALTRHLNELEANAPRPHSRSAKSTMLPPSQQDSTMYQPGLSTEIQEGEAAGSEHVLSPQASERILAEGSAEVTDSHLAENSVEAPPTEPGGDDE
jgi:cilia- and flagella-associated protein 57